MSLVNDYAGHAYPVSPTSTPAPLSSPFLKSLRIIAIALIVLGLLTTGIFLTTALVTGNFSFISLTIPGLLLLIPAIILFLKARKKDAVSVKKGVVLPGPLHHPETPSPKPVGPVDRSPLSVILEEEPVPVEEPEDLSHLPQSVRETRRLFRELFPKKVESPSPDIKIYESKGGVKVAFAKGPIEFSIFPIELGRKAIVFNDANSAYRPGGSGTNLSLSEAVARLSWRESAGRGGGYTMSNEELSENIARVGMVTFGNWISSPDYQQRWQATRPHPLLTPEMKNDPDFEEGPWGALGQMVGPRCSDCPDFKKDAFPVMRKLYSQAVCQLVQHGGYSIVQLPLISCGENAPTDPEQKNEWRALSAQAFFEGVCDLEKIVSSLPPELNDLKITIVEENEVACSDYLY